MKPITITLPLPSRHLSPNGRYHWAVKARAAQEARRYAAWQAHPGCIRVQGYPFRWESARIEVRPYYGDRRRHDSDNLLASLKPSIDGLVDAGMLADDNCVTYTLHPAAVDRERPRVEITITGEPARRDLYAAVRAKREEATR